MSEYIIKFEQSSDGNVWAGAFDVPVISVGVTREEAEERVIEVLGLYEDAMRESGWPAVELTKLSDLKRSKYSKTARIKVCH